MTYDMSDEDQTPPADPAAASDGETGGEPPADPPADPPAAAPAAEKSPYLARAKMLPIEGIVYCLEHGAVHEPTTDPFMTGAPECDSKEFRPVYYRGRKGDLDETGDSDGNDGSEWMADVVGGITRPTGDETPEELGEQDQPHSRIISATSLGALSTDERILVLQLVSRERNRARAALMELRHIIGVGDLREPEKTLSLLTSSYDKISDA